MVDGWVLRAATSADQAFITDMQYEALFVPPGEPRLARSVLDTPGLVRYHQDFGRHTGDVGVIAVAPGGELLGAAWVRSIAAGYGFVDDDTPELGIAVVDHARDQGLGTGLLEELLGQVPRCSLSVDDRNPALRLYERLGFRVVRRESNHHVVMVRTPEQGREPT